MTYRVKIAGTAAAAESVSDSQSLAAQGVTAIAGLAGHDRAGSGRKYFPGRKPLRRKELRGTIRKKYGTIVDKCLELGIMSEQSPLPEGGRASEFRIQSYQKNEWQKYYGEGEGGSSSL